MKNQTKIQFAVVREDPQIEIEVIKRISPQGKLLLIGSGGCTALTIANFFPNLTQTLVDPNPAQLELIKQKIQALIELPLSERKKKFGVNDGDSGYINGGNFESLFRQFRLFVYEFVMDERGWLDYFSDPTQPFPIRVFQSKYWSLAFRLFFSNDFLIALFGQEAVQHASESYAQYFQSLFERGLLTAQASQNYFLHHVFLGHYLDQKDSLPLYLSIDAKILSNVNFQYKNEVVQNLSSFSQYDLISLSNILDWMDESEVTKLAHRLKNETKPGTWIIYRQLNHHKAWQSLFGEEFQFFKEWAAQLHQRDKSLFYSSLHIAQKI